MPASLYKTEGIVLRRQRLGESDRVVTFLVRDGSLLRAVAKGAAKPAGALAARVEPFSVVRALCAPGRSLDIVKEAHVVEGNARIRTQPEHTACASLIAELLDRTSLEGLQNPRLYDMTVAALRAVNEGSASQAACIACAHAFKTAALLGVRPQFDSCVTCGDAVLLSGRGRVAFSFAEGGVVCPSCARTTGSQLIDAATLAWCRIMLFETFADLMPRDVPLEATFSALQFFQQWARIHFNVDLKSLNMLFTCGMF